MLNIIKVFRLDILLIKQYIKTIIYIMIIPVFLVITSESLVIGVITAMTLIAMRGTSLAFISEEKNSFNRFYGFIPVKKSELIIGRYLFIIIIGLSALIITIVSQAILLSYRGVSILGIDYFIAFILGITIYLFGSSFQLPAFYKFGNTQGAIFAYIPLVAFLLMSYMVGSLDFIGLETSAAILNNEVLFSIILLIISIALIFGSLIVSIKIYKNKEIKY